MRVLLDSKTVGNPSLRTISQAIAAAAADARSRNRLIVEVIIDGRAWTGEELEGPQADAPAAEVCITTADTSELVCETLADASLALAEADRLQQSSAGLIQGGQIVAAMPQLDQAITIWLSVQNALTMGLQVTGLDLAIAEEAIGHLNGHLRAIRDALQNQDTAALSDALMYDFPQVVLEWRGMLNDLQAQFRPTGV